MQHFRPCCLLGDHQAALWGLPSMLPFGPLPSPAPTAGWSLGAQQAPSWGIGGGNGQERRTEGPKSDCFLIVKLHRKLP